jgi:hypothetical protein
MRRVGGLRGPGPVPAMTSMPVQPRWLPPALPALAARQDPSPAVRHLLPLHHQCRPWKTGRAELLLPRLPPQRRGAGDTGLGPIGAWGPCRMCSVTPAPRLTSSSSSIGSAMLMSLLAQRLHFPAVIMMMHTKSRDGPRWRVRRIASNTVTEFNLQLNSSVISGTGTRSPCHPASNTAHGMHEGTAYAPH